MTDVKQHEVSLKCCWDSVQDFIDATLYACREVEKFLRNNTDISLFKPRNIGAGGDVSMGFDLEAEQIFIRHLSCFGQISSEESGLIGEGKDLIILDPIDGSDNFKSLFPYYGASIALQQEGQTVAAVVANFASGECFVRFEQKHYITFLNNFSTQKPVSQHAYSKVGIFEKAVLHPKYSALLIESGLKFRSPGAVALSLAYAHFVKYVVFFGTMRPYDIEAGIFLCEGLFRYQDNHLLIISKERDVFEHLCNIFQIPKESA